MRSSAKFAALAWAISWLLTSVVGVLADDMLPEVERTPIEMTLPEAVLLAVRNNIGLQNAYLSRVVDKYALWVEEGKFVPQGSLEAQLRTIHRRPAKGTNTDAEELRLGGSVVWKAPTGADFVFLWSNDSFHSNERGQGTRNALGAAVTQPLLRGGGIDINRISIDVARNNYESARQGLRGTLSSTITEVIRSYRAFTVALVQLDLEEKALERAERLVEMNKALISAGRMARSELVQAQAEVANRRLTLASSENAADQARLTLIGLLNMDRTTQIVPVEPIELVEVDLDFKRFFDIALVERPDYLQAKFGAENSAMNKRLADNNSQWTLNLTATAGINNQADRWLEPLPPGRYDEDWSAGVNLIIPLFDRSLRAQRVQADVAVLQSKNSVVDLRQQIGREITDAIRNTEISRSQVDLARQSRQLSEEQLAIETEKLRLGRSTNFRVIDFQTDLLTAQINETSSVAAYLNALTDLDLTLGTTLETWQIELQRLPIPSGL